MISWGLRITQNGDWHNNFLEELQYFAVRKKQKKTGLGGKCFGRYVNTGFLYFSKNWR